MTKTMRLALLVLNALATLLQLYARTTDHERDDRIAAKIRDVINDATALLA